MRVVLHPTDWDATIVLGPSEGGLGGQDALDGFPPSGRNSYTSGVKAFFADVGGMCPYHGRRFLCGWFAHWLYSPIILLLDICTNIDKYSVLTTSEYNISPSIIYISYWLLTISLG